MTSKQLTPAQEARLVAAWLAGREAGTAAAETFGQIRTHSMTAPAGSSPMFRSGWRLGFANVRNRVVRADDARASSC